MAIYKNPKTKPNQKRKRKIKLNMIIKINLLMTKAHIFKKNRQSQIYQILSVKSS